MAWLDDHPPVRSQFRRPRRERPSGVCVVHTAENTPDFEAFDGGAEAVANFIRNRSDPGSYHDLVDSDSAIQLVRWEDEAFQDGTGSNPHAWGGSVATRADVWPLAPAGWRDGAVRQLAQAAARYARWLHAVHGIVVPARRVNRAESDLRVPGFISHAERDPGRRSDPGAGFPWDQFLAEYDAAMGGTLPEEDDFMGLFADGEAFVAHVDLGVKRAMEGLGLRTAEDVVQVVNNGVLRALESDKGRELLAGTPVDVAALAAGLAPVLVEQLAPTLAAAIPETLAEDTADIIAERLAD